MSAGAGASAGRSVERATGVTTGVDAQTSVSRALGWVRGTFHGRLAELGWAAPDQTPDADGMAEDDVVDEVWTTDETPDDDEDWVDEADGTDEAARGRPVRAQSLVRVWLAGGEVRVAVPEPPVGVLIDPATAPRAVARHRRLVAVGEMVGTQFRELVQAPDLAAGFDALPVMSRKPRATATSSTPQEGTTSAEPASAEAPELPAMTREWLWGEFVSSSAEQFSRDRGIVLALPCGRVPLAFLAWRGTADTAVRVLAGRTDLTTNVRGPGGIAEQVGAALGVSDYTIGIHVGWIRAVHAYPALVASARAERTERPESSDEIVDRLASRLAIRVAEEQSFRVKTDRNRHLPVLRRAIVGALR